MNYNLNTNLVIIAASVIVVAVAVAAVVSMSKDDGTTIHNKKKFSEILFYSASQIYMYACMCV